VIDWKVVLAGTTSVITTPVSANPVVLLKPTP
jgi:hypothetical protein